MKIHVELTANFERNLDAINAFWQEYGAPHAYDDLLTELLQTVIPNLEQHPRYGRDFMAGQAGTRKRNFEVAVIFRGRAKTKGCLPQPRMITNVFAPLLSQPDFSPAAQVGLL